MNSLLDQIKSKYILQYIFSLAFQDMKSVHKLIKYNKNLSNRLNIDIKKDLKNIDDNYKFKKEIKKTGCTSHFSWWRYNNINSFIYICDFILYKRLNK